MSVLPTQSWRSNGHLAGISEIHIFAFFSVHLLGLKAGIENLGNDSPNLNHHFGALAFLPDLETIEIITN
jgi:hypothetical protein